jgi:acyl-coenzyme A synthetase/AMP-(fatty) acid ligase
MNKNLIKIIGFAATAIGVIATIAQGWVSEKQMEERIDEKVSKALAESQKENDESEEES